VIHEVDEALRTLVKRDALNGADVEVAFDAPTKEWAARRNAPTLDLYLYDIREDTKWRAYGQVDVRDGSSQFVTARESPPRRFKLAYLLTAWTQRPEDEHRLLGAVLSCLLRFDALPRNVLVGTLADLGMPVTVTVALPPPDDRAVSDVWTALGGELKPSLDIVVTFPVDTRRRRTDIAPPVLEEPRVEIVGSDGSSEQARPRRPRNGAPRSSRPQAATVGGAGARVEDVPDETVTGGRPGRSGRRIRVRGDAPR
jgi:hypothetical protein